MLYELCLSRLFIHPKIDRSGNQWTPRSRWFVASDQCYFLSMNYCFSTVCRLYNVTCWFPWPAWITIFEWIKCLARYCWWHRCVCCAGCRGLPLPFSSSKGLWTHSKLILYCSSITDWCVKFRNEFFSTIRGRWKCYNGSPSFLLAWDCVLFFPIFLSPHRFYSKYIIFIRLNLFIFFPLLFARSRIHEFSSPIPGSHHSIFCWDSYPMQDLCVSPPVY